MNFATASVALAILTSTGASPALPDDLPKMLQQGVFEPLPLGAVKPEGWLKQQLKTQADGLSGHLDEFWPDIKDAAWFGGNAEGWERVPYWLDGLVPLAYQLDDPRLIEKVKRAVDYILEHQQPDGWLGPIGDNNPRHKPYDVWPLFPLFKALTQYQEASGDTRIVPALVRCAKKIDQVITQEPLYSWAHYRAADFVVSLYWLHARTGDESLLALARKALDQAYDWRRHFEHFEEEYAQKTEAFGLDNHGVNNGMALKFGGMRWRLSGDAGDRALIDLMHKQLDRYHGQATGMFTCDEHYAGRSPSQGTELCTVVEAMYSLELLVAMTGEVALADRLERIAFNALPATFKKDMTAHQYDQQCNQVVCSREGEHVYTNNGPDSNLYGLEPNFGCCTANLHQGWPKFVSSLWMRSRDNGLAAIAYAPCALKTEVSGQPVSIDVRTRYPFNDVVFVTVKTQQPTEFPIYLRVPDWSENVHILFKNSSQVVDDEQVDAPEGGTLVTKPGGGFVKVAANWSGSTTFVMEFRNSLELYDGFNGAVAILRGPLVFALPIEPDWRRIKDRPDLAFDDWEVHPKSDWNFGLEVDRDHLERTITVEKREAREGPFGAEAPAVVLKVKGRKLADWGLEKSAALPPPKSPVATSSPAQELLLVPYGGTDLRITEFPLVGTSEPNR